MSSTSEPKKLIFAPGELSTSTSTAATATPTTSTTADPASSTAASRAAQFQLNPPLTRSLLSANPLSQFHTWFTHPSLPASTHPETATFATASLPSGRVAARVVYLKELDSRGFVVYSNWGTSRKGADYESNRWGALTFWWSAVERQVRVEGVLERLRAEESQTYYDTRERGSRLGAWASAQSSVLVPKEEEGGELDDGRAQLEERVKAVTERFEGTEKIPVPEFWGGVRLVPVSIEFWQGAQSRLHDRFRYRRVVERDGKEVDVEDVEGVFEGTGDEWKWVVERLSP